MPDLALSCSCGRWQATLCETTPARGNRVICYCDDCQAFAHFLGDPGERLDAAGGSDIFQVSSRRLRVDAGRDQMACVRLSGRGMERWYTSCCRTPIGNTMPGGALGFVGLLHSALTRNTSAAEASAAIGPVRMRVMGNFAKGGAAAVDACPKTTPRMVRQLAKILGGAALKRVHDHAAFRDPESGAPTAAPRVLTAEERAEIERARETWIRG